MRSINLLDEDTINKIAAGEVVARPASVVKELVENSIDALSSAVTVEIKDGGISFIRVTDNGSGIDSEDVENAFVSHATSKIHQACDLLSIASLGFRGEALASIAAVSRVEMITKPHPDLTGTRYCIEGGSPKQKEEIGAPDGTTIIARDLFYNTPARRKFLKSPGTEAGYISELMGHLALSRPDISFQYIQNNQNRLHTAGNSSLRDIIYQVYGRDVTAHLLPVQYESDILSVSGFIGKPILSRGNRRWETYFINQRYIKSNIITQAIEDAYKTFVMVHKYPFTVLHFTIDPSLLDVNVHPQKMELRFGKAKEIYQRAYDVIRGILEGRDLAPQVSLAREEKKEQTAPGPEPFEIQRLAGMGIHPQAEKNPYRERKVSGSSLVREDKAPFSDQKPQNMPADRLPKSQKPQQMTLAQSGLMNADDLDQIHLLGQVFDTYWMIEYQGKLFIIDQHAAHEKVLYERLLKAFRSHSVKSQLLAPPVILRLSGQEQVMLRNYQDEITGLGFEIEPFGGDDYAISAVPLQLFGMNAADMMIEVLDSLNENSGSLEGSAITYRIASMACKAAVKGNTRFSRQEALALIREMMEADNPYNCPHGRPTMISISRYEMDKRFKRIQD